MEIVTARKTQAWRLPEASFVGGGAYTHNMQHTNDASKYPLHFFYGVVLALIGSSLQAFGLCLWKLHNTWRCSKTTVSVETVHSTLPTETATVVSQDKVCKRASLT